jgi:hypothetical protein
MRRTSVRFFSVAGGLFLAGACGEDTAKSLAVADGGRGGSSLAPRDSAGAPPEGGEGGAPMGGAPESDRAGAASNEGGAPPGTCNHGKGATVRGRVTSPSGELPLAGVSVYVPSETVDAPPGGASCFRCTAAWSGVPVALTVTDAEGRFELENVPAGDQVPSGSLFALTGAGA